MNVELLKLRIAVEKKEGEGGVLLSVKALFFSEGVKIGEGAPEVSCNRVGGGCMTPIDNLQAHNDHVPSFQDEVLMDSWAARIQGDVEEAAAAYDGEYSSPEDAAEGTAKWG
jgi:hypothetical protein